MFASTAVGVVALAQPWERRTSRTAASRFVAPWVPQTLRSAIHRCPCKLDPANLPIIILVWRTMKISRKN